MTSYTSLESPTDTHARVKRIVEDWTEPVLRTFTRTDELKRKQTEVAPKSFTEHRLIAEVVLFAKNENVKAEEIIIPEYALLTLFKPLDKWKPENIVKARNEELRLARVKGLRQFRKADAQRKRIAVFVYREGTLGSDDQVDRQITIFDDCDIKVESFAIERRYVG